MDRRSSRLRRRVVLVGAVATLAVVTSAPPASGAVTIGSNLSESDFVNGPCSMLTCTMFNGSLPAGRTLTSPIDGVVVRWRLRQGNNGAPATFALRVLRPVTLGPPISEVTALATGAGELFPTPAGTYAFDTRLPIAAGDTIGMNASDVHGVVATSDATGQNQLVEGPFPDNTTRMVDHGFAAQLMLNADIEADADRDVFGDETQDKCLGTPGPSNGCPSSVTLGKVKQKGKKVKVTATVPGAGTLSVGSASALAAQAAKGKPSVRTVSRTLTSTSTQTVVLTLKLTKSAIGKLDDAGKLKLKVKAVYTPVGGPPGSQTKKKKLRS